MDLDNILVRQKNLILSHICKTNYIEALIALEIVRELWIEAEYGYKMNELLHLIPDSSIIGFKKKKLMVSTEND